MCWERLDPSLEEFKVFDFCRIKIGREGGLNSFSILGLFFIRCGGKRSKALGYKDVKSLQPTVRRCPGFSRVESAGPRPFWRWLLISFL